MRSVSAATMRHALQRPRPAPPCIRAPARFAPRPLALLPRRYASASPLHAPRPSELPVAQQDQRPVFAAEADEDDAPTFAPSRELSRDDKLRLHRGAPGSQARSKGKFDVWCKKMTAAKTLPELDDVIGRMATSRVNMHLIHYNVALSRYYLLGSATKAELLLASMKNAGITPDIATYNVQLNHSISERNDARTAALLQETQKLGLQPNDMTHSLLAKHWVNQGDFKSVELLLDNLTARNVVPSRFFWSKLIDGYARQGNAEAAEKTVERMARLGLEMDIYSMGALLSAYVNAGATDKSRAVMGRVMQQGLKTNSVIWTTYINGLLKEPRVALHKRIANAEEAISQMRKCRVLIDSHTACTMVRAYNEALQWEKSHAFLKQALQEGLRPSTAVFNSLMSAWVGQGRLEDAEKVLDEIENAKMKPSIISYNILIHAYCEKEQGEHALALLKRAQTSGIEPDVATYDIIAQGLLKKKQTAAAAEVLTQMIGKRMSPSRPAMYALIRQLTDTMKLKEAEDWLDENRRMGFAPSLQQTAHLLLQYSILNNDGKAAEWQRRLMESKYTPEEKDRALRWCKKHMARSRAKQTGEIDEPTKPAPTAEQELQSLLDSH